MPDARLQRTREAYRWSHYERMRDEILRERPQDWPGPYLQALTATTAAALDALDFNLPIRGAALEELRKEWF